MQKRSVRTPSFELLISPVRLQCVVPDAINALQLEGPGPKRPFRGDCHASKEIRFAGARRAGAGAAKLLERVVRLVGVLPDDDQQISDDLM